MNGDPLDELDEQGAEITRLLAEVERLREVNGWVPVIARLPEPDVDVLVHFAIGGFEVGCIEGLSGHWLCARDVCRDEATHWMPLPEPPG